MPGDFKPEEMERWVTEHGSPRLKKIQKAGLLKVSHGAYRAERLKFERPGWEFLDVEQLTTQEIKKHLLDPLNPSEEAVDAFLHAQELYRDDNYPVRLMRWKNPGDEGKIIDLVVQNFLGRQAAIAVGKYLKQLDPDRQTVA